MLRTSVTRFYRAGRVSANVRSFGSSAPNSGSNDEKSYVDRMEATGRPVSPHVTIYAFPVTAVSSIMTRATGVGLAGGMAVFGVWGVLGGTVEPALLMHQIGNTPLLGTVAKFSVAFPLVYHYLSALRHFDWDSNPEKLETEEVTQSSEGLIGAATMVATCAAII